MSIPRNSPKFINVFDVVNSNFVVFIIRAKEVDPVPYLATNLVDDFASHIRLYRRTIDKMNLLRLDTTKPPPDLQETFFDLECEMEKNICRDALCMSKEHEIGEYSYLSLLFLGV